MDTRDRGGNRKPVFEGIELPCKFEVCSLCEGEGTHVNPSIDAHGVSGEEFAELMEDYANGFFNILCNECHGLRVVWVVDRERCSSHLLAAWDMWEEELLDFRSMQESERRVGA